MLIRKPILKPLLTCPHLTNRASPRIVLHPAPSDLPVSHPTTEVHITFFLCPKVNASKLRNESGFWRDMCRAASDIAFFWENFKTTLLQHENSCFLLKTTSLFCLQLRFLNIPIVDLYRSTTLIPSCFHSYYDHQTLKGFLQEISTIDLLLRSNGPCSNHPSPFRSHHLSLWFHSI